MIEPVKWEQELTAHRSDRGLVHGGPREWCVSIDCLPPALGVREGDTVRVSIPDQGIDGDFVVTSEPSEDGASVTMTLRSADA